MPRTNLIRRLTLCMTVTSREAEQRSDKWSSGLQIGLRHVGSSLKVFVSLFPSFVQIYFIYEWRLAIVW